MSRYFLIILFFLSACSTLNNPPLQHSAKPDHTPAKKPVPHNQINAHTTPSKNSDSQQIGQPASQQPPSEKLKDFSAAVISQSWQKVMDLGQVLIGDATLSSRDLIDVFQGRAKAFEATEFYSQIVLDCQTILGNPALATEHPACLNKSFILIESKISQGEIEKLNEALKNDQLLAATNYRLGQIFLDLRQTDSAKKFFAKTANLTPNTEIGVRAKEIIQQLEAAKRVEAKTIGAVLPMTGKFANISRKTLRGLQMGLGLYNGNFSNFKLAVVDSEGNSENARRGVDRLVQEDNVIAIVGSVLSKTSSGVSSKASELGVPNITLAQKAGLTETSANVFRNSLTSEMQVRQLVKAAMENLGIKRFAILFPNDQYGIEYANIFWDEVLARGGTITAAQSYSSKETDFRSSIQRLTGTYYLEDRIEEYRFRLKEWSDAQTKKSARNTPPEDLLPPLVNFEAVFIPDNAKSLGQIAAMMNYSRIKDVKFLGTNLWNVPGLAKRVGPSAKNVFFVDSFLASDKNYQNSQFVKEYKKYFNEDPGQFEIQAYDSALILRQLISNGNTSRDSLSSALSNLKQFPGSLGPLEMSSEREILRPLVTLTLQNGEITAFEGKTN